MDRRRRRHPGSSVRLAASPASSYLSLLLLLLSLLLASASSRTSGLQQPLLYSPVRPTTTRSRSTTRTLYAAGAANRDDNSIQEESRLLAKGATAKVIEVCTSPGCCADGASNTLVRLQGLQAWMTSSSNTVVQIREGGCRSLCGNGPIVSVTSSSSSSSSSSSCTKIVRQVKGNDKMMNVLSNLDGERADADAIANAASMATTNVLRTIMDAFNLLDEARRNQQNNHGDSKEIAIRLYQQGIELGLKALQQQEQGSNERSIDKVAWLIEATHTQIDCLVQQKRFTEAADAAEVAVSLCDSCTFDGGDDGNKINVYLYASLEHLQASLEQQSDTTGLPSSSSSSPVAEREGAALERLLALTPPSKLSTTQHNKRRTLGFRLQRLPQR